MWTPSPRRGQRLQAAVELDALKQGGGKLGRGAAAPPPSASFPSAAAKSSGDGKMKIRVRERFGSTFYTTGGYIWAILDLGPG